ncbi:DUF349 domain-containing protein [Catalinimonas niigatensis]|uniref:DUF349 domain-containing protein n=1 Tax=Catalinimonas niigatensis TaxID=1397264 RepID=UPI002666E8CE|nr:DUF349 domain-containing protein [Catalinimonas niigatensis]WPP52568.1 DUF349 domain-containing protein [Catalinimonas niigatensis]
MEPNNPYGFIKDGKIYRNAFLEYPEREIGEVRESEESTIKYFEDRFAMAENKVNTLAKSVEESDNKGSYLMKLVHMRVQLANFDALGDYMVLYKKLDELEEMLREIIFNNRIKNLEIKKALIAEAEVFENSTDWQEAADQLKEIKNKWIRTGAVDKEHEEEIEGRFTQVLDTFFQRRNQFFEDRKKLFGVRIQKYYDIIYELRGLQRSDDRQAAISRVKELQNTWRDIGKIPPKLYGKLFKDFKYLTGKFFKPQNRFSSGGSSGGYRSSQGSGGYRSSSPSQSGSSRPYGSSRPSGSSYPPRRRPDENPYASEYNVSEMLERKKELLSQANQLSDKEGEDVVEDVKRLRFLWKRTGKLPRDVGGSITYDFIRACDMASEKSFLNRLARSKNPDYDNIDIQKKINLKINLLNNLIVRDQKELDLYKENVEKFSSDAYNVDRQIDIKFKAQQRKVAVKRALMEELVNNLNAQK